MILDCRICNHFLRPLTPEDILRHKLTIKLQQYARRCLYSRVPFKEHNYTIKNCYNFTPRDTPFEQPHESLYVKRRKRKIALYDQQHGIISLDTLSNEKMA